MVDVLVVALMLMIMTVGLGLGATLTVADFKLALKQPKAVGVGWLCQFGIMPLIAFSYAKMFGVDDRFAIGMVLTGSAPGGTTSNLMSYWVKGNVALSITMSAASLTCALFMMPLLILIYIESSFTSKEDLEIPYVNIVGTLLLLIVPTFLGMGIKARNDVWAKRLEKVGSVLGAVFLVAALVIGLVQNSDLLDQPFSTWFMAVSLQIFGCFFGYVIATLVGMNRPDARTISLETGVQNSTLIIAMIGISFQDDTQLRDDVWLFPLMYSLCYVVNSIWITLFMRHVLAPRDPPLPGKGVDDDNIKVDPERGITLSRLSTGNLQRYGDKNADKDADEDDSRRHGDDSASKYLSSTTLVSPTVATPSITASKPTVAVKLEPVTLE
eukprot:TRINITY_DN66830_c13_g11_i1.p1 TRINITY_DN66830_c13_g11~~TRINITY_DN66830_c13_g11_i1.p1  ORF type:complete len:383 (-),score=204.01 TRINITY_DN66830_c13_g11_i1:120-1268(-)